MDFFFSVAFVIWIYMTIAFLFALLIKDNSVVDVFWGMGFILVAVFSLIRTGNLNDETLWLNLMVLAWGTRLSVHIYIRNRGKEEDFRYRAWRENWNFFILRSYFQIFMLQGLFMLLISSPVWFVNLSSTGSFGIFQLTGILLFLAGFLFEAAGDYQLARFRRNPLNKGKIITTGLWRFTRHPNYFGEALLWWGLALFAAGHPLGWITLLSPLTLTLLLRYVSGVPMLEKKYEGRPDWKAYAEKTAPFVPFLQRF